MRWAVNSPDAVTLTSLWLEEWELLKASRECRRNRRAQPYCGLTSPILLVAFTPYNKGANSEFFEAENLTQILCDKLHIGSVLRERKRLLRTFCAVSWALRKLCQCACVRVSACVEYTSSVAYNRFLPHIFQLIIYYRHLKFEFVQYNLSLCFSRFWDLRFSR
jgi:hypothetical protein